MDNNDNQKPKPPTFRFKKIGSVKEAEVELGNLTIIAGRNNTGKTYLVYTLYGFLKTLEERRHRENLLVGRRNFEVVYPDIQGISGKVNQEGRASFPLDRKQFRQQQEKIIRRFARVFSKRDLPIVFSSHQSNFEGSSIEVDFSEDAFNGTYSVKEEFRGDISLSMEYDGSNLVVNTGAIENQRRIPNLEPYIAHQYSLLLLQNLLPEPFILSAERFGISLFYRELDFTKNQLVDVLQNMGNSNSRDRVSPYLVINRATSRYARPIKDNIDYTRGILDLENQKSEISECKLFDDIKDMINGYYGSSGDDIRFISKARGKGRSFNIPLHLASSSVRGLSDFYFFLKHVATKNHLLIVDEPESHLDTSNQILLARLLARCVRSGLKVLITTHSDYLIKEINNLVMLSRPFKDKAAVIRRLKYSADDFLDPESIRAYVAEDNSLTRCDVDRFGIDMPVFDETIDRINRVANDLASRMSEDSEA